MQKLAKSLSIFRGKINTVRKDANNPFFKSKYADLPAILDAIKEPLSESWLALFHRATDCDWSYSLWTYIVDIESWEESISEFPLFWTKPQELWSSITYARRYNILALLDIPTDEDDDGNIANTATKTTKTVDTPNGQTKQKTLTSTNECCPECWEECKTKSWTTKEWKPYEMWTCDSCDVRFFINRPK